MSALGPPSVPFGRTLQARFLLALVLIGVLPLALVGLGVATLDRQALVNQSSQELAGLARGFAGELEVHFDDLTSICRGLAVLPAIVGMNPAQQETALRNLSPQYEAFARISTFDTTGRRVASSVDGGASLIAELEAFQTAMARGQQAWDVHPALTGGRSSLTIVTPIRDADRNVVGAVGVVIDMATLSDVVEHVAVGAGGQAFVLDDDGRVLLHPDRQLVQERPDYSGLGVPVGSRLVGPGTVHYTLDGEARVAGYAPVGTLGWTVVVERPEAAVLDPADRSWRLALSGLGISMLLALVAALWLARTLTRPVRELARAAEAFGAGDPAAPLPKLAPASDELGSLVAAFATMREAVAGREAERAQLLAREQAARAAAEAAERRFAFLAEASTLLASSLDYQATLTSVARLAVPHLADWAAVDVVDDEGVPRTVEVAHADPAKVELARAVHARLAPGPGAPNALARALSTGQPVFLPQVSPEIQAANITDPEHLRLVRELGPRSLMVVPLCARGRTLGALTLASADSGRVFGPDDLALAEDLARRCALAVDNARLYKQAQEAVRARDEFLSIASHELRTPLAGVKGFAQVLQAAQARGQLVPDQLARGLQRIDEASNRLNDLIQDLLDVSRIRMGQLLLRPHPLDLAVLLREVTSRFGEQLDGRHRLVVDLAVEPCTIVADAHRIEQILTNLLDNAAKYSPQGGQVHVRLLPSDGGVLVQVQDAGIGLPGESVDSVFEPFGRAPNAARRHIPGMGLGLYICREIAQRHGGRIWAESRGEDQGTTFSLWLPRAAVAAEAAPAPAPAPDG
ncbi:MAG TPA: cache domain-containing protein [Chloroflexota bacterium]|nr:cache domain-containing protein [Chloroflexota bacterium]